MRCLSLLFILACALPLTSAQELLYNETAYVNTISALWDAIAISFSEAIPLNATPAIKVTLDVTPCDNAGIECDPESTIFAAAQLYCGTNEDGVWDFISAIPGRHQEIVISPLSPVAYPNNATAGLLICSALVPNYMPTVVKLNFQVTAGNNITTLVPAQQEAAKTLFDTCCTASGACDPWDQATEAAGKDFTSGEVFTDLCNIDNNICDASGSLTLLNLDGYALSCDLATLDFSNFTTLEYLSVARNNLTGDFGAATTALAKQLRGLKSLDVGLNPLLAGELDTADTSGLCSLAAGGLEWLGMYRTGITGELPPCLFGKNSKLQELLAAFSRISGSIPSTLSTSPNLAVLTLDHTQLSGPIPAFPPSLVKLNLSMNAHTDTIPDFSKSDFLTNVDLSNNQLSGPVPDSVHNHPTLRYLDLRANALTGLPKVWTDDPKKPDNEPLLGVLLLSFNPLKAPFPKGLAFYPNLTTLDIGATELSGTLPDVPEGGFGSLDQLYMENNTASGPIPDSWSNMYIFDTSNLDPIAHAFILANNTLTGNIPEFLSQARPDALVLDISGNDFDNACDDAFIGLGACKAPPGTGGTNGDSSSGGGGGGLSGGAIAGIVILVLVVVGVAGFFLWRRYQRHGGGAARFQRFDDEVQGLEMGRPSGGREVYNPQLAP